MPFLYGLLLLLIIAVPVMYGLRYFIDYMIEKTPEEAHSKEDHRLKHPLANISSNRGTILVIGILISLIFSHFVINYKTYTLDFDAPTAKKDTLFVDPLMNIEITEQKPRPKPKKEIAIEVKETKKPVIDTTKIFTPEDDEPIEDVIIVSNDVVTQEVTNDEPVLTADVMPRFEGGTVAFQKDPNFLKYVKQNFNKNKIREGETGTIYVSFIIEKNGKITDVKILRGMNERLDNEVIRVVGLIPDFTSPAMRNGVPVRLKFNWPFKIN